MDIKDQFETLILEFLPYEDNEGIPYKQLYKSGWWFVCDELGIDYDDEELGELYDNLFDKLYETINNS